VSRHSFLPGPKSGFGGGGGAEGAAPGNRQGNFGLVVLLFLETALFFF
jgi:hypothetical protein